MGWLNYEDFKARYPSTTLTEADFPALAGEAEMAINDQTFWRAQVATDEDSLAALATCEAQLIQLALTTDADSAVQSSLTGVTSVSNHGYTEAYAAADQTLSTIERERRQIINTVLSGPSTRWMLYKGGVYHPRGRRHY